MDYEAFLRVPVELFIVVFTAWGVAGLIASVMSLRTKRSTLQAWWRGSTYFGPRSSLHHQFE